MALKDKWVDKVDGVDIASAEDINQVAQAVIELERKTDGIKVPIKGVDYWTDEDVEDIKAYVDEAILGGVW